MGCETKGFRLLFSRSPRSGARRWRRHTDMLVNMEDMPAGGRGVRETAGDAKRTMEMSGPQ